jgi:hypothetical protein
MAMIVLVRELNEQLEFFMIPPELLASIPVVNRTIQLPEALQADKQDRKKSIENQSGMRATAGPAQTKGNEGAGL